MLNKLIILCTGRRISKENGAHKKSSQMSANSPTQSYQFSHLVSSKLHSKRMLLRSFFWFSAFGGTDRRSES